MRRPSPSALARRGSPPCFRSEVEYSRDRPFYGDDCIEEFQHPVVTNSAEPLWGFWSLMSKAERREHCQQWLAFHLARCDAIEHDEPQPDYPQ